MIRRFSRVLAYTITSLKIRKNATSIKTNFGNKITSSLWTPIVYRFADLPKHKVLQMPALSPTMSEGKVVKWNKNVGDALEEGDIICEVETDKATVGFQVTQKGFLAQKRDTDKPIPVGTPLIVVVPNKQLVKSFEGFKFDESEKKSESAPQQPQQQKQQQPKKAQGSQQAPSKSYPKHQQLKMPALSPTMSQGKIVKWNVKQGQQYSQGDSLCDIETDKATVAFEATQKGVLAKILAKENSQLKVGDLLGISVKSKQDASQFADYKAGGAKPESKPQKAEPTQQAEKKQTSQQPQRQRETQQSEGQRVFASPLAKNLAHQKGIDLKEIGRGSGPEGRIIKQDIESYQPASKQKPAQKTAETKEQKPEAEQKPTPKAKPQKIDIPENPFQQIPLTNMRKTIAARLTESKTTIPHYYVKVCVEMDRINAVRNQLNANEKENGVKISVNDIIVKAMALALRDYPTVNAQWHGNSVRRFKYADISVAVATQGGLITPIVYRADTLGLIDIAKRTKDIAKRARQGKLDPREYIGGTTTISNLGMYGIDSVTSVINPPQSTILGVGQTEKKILFDKQSKNPEKPFRVAQVMELIVSADHRVVDGAMAAQWVTRIKKYLEHPSQMLL